MATPNTTAHELSMHNLHAAHEIVEALRVMPGAYVELPLREPTADPNSIFLRTQPRLVMLDTPEALESPGRTVTVEVPRMYMYVGAWVGMLAELSKEPVAQEDVEQIAVGVAAGLSALFVEVELLGRGNSNLLKWRGTN